MATLKSLLTILGTDVYDLTEKELALAYTVADWYDGSPHTPAQYRITEEDIIQACHYALEKEGTSWDDVMLHRVQKKKVVELRYAIILILWRRLNGTQAHKAKLIGLSYNHATIIYAYKNATNWLVVDRAFKNLYERLSESINEYLEKLIENETDNKTQRQ